MAQLSIRIDLGPDARLGPGKVRLLELIAEHGSISAAGRALGMSYRRAWTLVADLNRLFGRPVVEGQTGGRSGGGATLTPFGIEVIACYRAIEEDALEVAAGRLAALRRAAGTGPGSAANGPGEEPKLSRSDCGTDPAAQR
ncbi:LysR family transcriptional regulator [uncultured Methylobacterium sp.]|jgi:molybdate transport system regulatory protein|uniref:winged helix-turn-helix domain-containing protein n=1 Tax=uncultured Methylobacterium sp. TaxID=157278 RepID=UPI0026038E62|nr:LysR family transcriptional regulator [uncultured Methylobacterium sp.]